MTTAEIEALLLTAIPARLATIDHGGFPHVTPLWFIWADDAFYLTSIIDRPHLRRLAANPRASVCIDVEEAERDDGHRPNQQVRAIGRTTLFPDQDGLWTGRITEKYVRGPSAVAMRDSRVGDERMVICLRPEHLIAVASI
jgi:hypothetical protein